MKRPADSLSNEHLLMAAVVGYVLTVTAFAYLIGSVL